MNQRVNAKREYPLSDLLQTNGGVSPNAAHRRDQGGGQLLIFLLLILLYYGSYFVLRGARTANPQLIAHRGAHQGRSGKVPENTLAAFRNAINLGADWLEMDVQMTKDGALVVIHDETVERTTKKRTTRKTNRVADLTLAEVRALDAGNGEQIPTFREVIHLAKEANIPIMPEAKFPIKWKDKYPDLEKEMMETMIRHIEEAGCVARTAVQSFEASALDRLRTLNPDIKTCALHRWWNVNLGHPQPGDANIVCPMAEMVVLYPWMIKQAHKTGYQVFVWFGVIDHPLVMRFILALGADGLMVDDTATLAKVLGR